MVLPTYLLAF